MKVKHYVRCSMERTVDVPDEMWNAYKAALEEAILESDPRIDAMQEFMDKNGVQIVADEYGDDVEEEYIEEGV